jgi:protocatechuate 3,4-dioxygenase beta subunit
MIYFTRRFCPSLILISALIVCLAGTALAQTPDAKSKATGSVSGRVTIGDKPAPGIVVVAGGMNQSSVTAQATSDADGHYRIGGLVAGQISITPAAPLYVLPSSPMTGSSKVVTLSSGEAVDGIDFKLTRGGVITGRVVDADGRPLIEERINLLLIDENGASRQQFSRYSYQMYQTDDRGVYRLYGVPAGRYKISAGDEPGTISGLRASGYYQKTYYPDATDVAKASVVDLNEGGEAKDIDITLGRRSVTYTVSGRIVDSDTGKPLPGISFAFGVLQKNQNQSYIAGTSSPGTPTNSQGEFRLEGVEPGHYAVFIMNRFDFVTNSSSGPSVFSDPLPFDVVDGDITNLEVKAQQGLSVSGVVVPDGITDQKVLAKISSLKIGATVIPTQGSLRVMPEGHSGTIGLDGSFQMGGFRPGKVSLYLTGSSGYDTKGFSITRVERGGVPQTTGLDLQPGENVSTVRILLAYGSGVIRGQVKSEGGTLPSEAMMFISLTRDGLPTRSSAQVDSRGQFVIDGLPAGTYEVNLQAVLPFPGDNMPRGMPIRQKQVVTVTEGADSTVLFTLDLTKKEGP